MRESLTTFKGCTDGAGDQDLDVIYSAGRAALEYICHNNGEQIIGILYYSSKYIFYLYNLILFQNSSRKMDPNV